MAFDVAEREYGAVKKTEEELQAYPVPRNAPSTTPTPQISPVSQTISGAGDDYELDIKATSPLSTLPVDVQEKAVLAKAWFEIAAHPAATEFEQRLAAYHYDLLEGPKPKPEKSEKDKK